MKHRAVRHLLSTLFTLGLVAALSVGFASTPTFATGSSQTDRATQARGECQPEQDEAEWRATIVHRKQVELAQARKQVRGAERAFEQARTPREKRMARERLAAAESQRATAKSALKRARARSDAANTALEVCLAGG